MFSSCKDEGQQDGAAAPQAYGAHPQILDLSQPFCHELFRASLLSHTALW